MRVCRQEYRANPSIGLQWTYSDRSLDFSGALGLTHCQWVFTIEQRWQFLPPCISGWGAPNPESARRVTVPLIPALASSRARDLKRSDRRVFLTGWSQGGSDARASLQDLPVLGRWTLVRRCPSSGATFYTNTGPRPSRLCYVLAKPCTTGPGSGDIWKVRWGGAFSAALREVPRNGRNWQARASPPSRDPQLYRCFMAVPPVRRRSEGEHHRWQRDGDAGPARRDQRGAGG
jgi:hypothetical protein